MSNTVPWPWNKDGVTSSMVLADHLDRKRMEEIDGALGVVDPKTWTLEALPQRPTLADFFRAKRFGKASLHGLRSAARARRSGADDEIVLACLLHDVAFGLIRQDHGWWGAQLLEPYLSEKLSWAIRYHQALRFYPDPSVGYEYPELYVKYFGEDFTPEPYIERAYEEAREHKWYMASRLITVYDDYALDPSIQVPPVEEFEDVIGRHFKQPIEGLGLDASPTAHMWRTMINPNRAL